MRAAGAHLRTLRVLTAGVGLVSVVGVGATSFLIAQPERMLSDGGFIALASVLGVLPLAAGVCAPWAGLRLLRVLNTAVVVEYAVLLGALVVAAVGGWVAGEVPWFFTFTAAPVAAALVAGGRAAAWAVLATSALLVQVVRFTIDADWESAIANDVLASFAAASLLLLFGVLLRASRDLDESTAVALVATRARSEAEAENRVRDRMRTLVHDELLALLTFAARDEPWLRPAVAAEGSRIRRAIRELHERPEPGKLAAESASAVVARLSAAVAEELPGTPCETVISDGAVPGEVVEAVDGALRQALVNVRLHAGEGATAGVVMEVGSDRVHLRVHDDGVGFHPDAVTPVRMGIASSIVGRLDAVPGGAAEVVSQPGAGTVVTIEWAPVAGVSSPARLPGLLAGESDTVRRGLLLAFAVFLLAQGVLAALAASRAGDASVAVLALLGVAGALFGVGWRTLAPPSAVNRPDFRSVLQARMELDEQEVFAGDA